MAGGELKLGLNLGYWGIGPSGEEATAIVKAAEAAGIAAVVFDRGGYRYGGQVKALADAARAGGLAF